ncbi:MAG TPA: endopeptidase La [Anaerolineae bacterium]|nr:endopeptidase La [Anaerolineae bacterium]HQK12911.1 endopeptidase La [Anaerolineae bacterium]
MLPWFNTQEQNIDDLIRRIPEELPILPLRNTVAFPYIVMPLAVGIPRSVRLIEDVDRSNRVIGLVVMKDPTVEVPATSQVYQVGTAAIIHRVMRSDDGTLTVFIQGLERFRVVAWTAEEPYLKARVRLTPDIIEGSVIEEALRRSLLDVAARLAELIPQFPEEAIRFIQQLEDPRLLVYLLASNMRIDMAEAQQLLEADRMAQKMEHLVKVLTHELEVREIGQQIQEKAKEEIEKTQREYYLRQQMDAIRKELGEGDEGRREVEEYRQKIAECGMTDEAKEEAERELARLEKMPPQAAEYWVIKTYLDWLVALPWKTATEDHLEISDARAVLDEDHYDLEDVKERILEFLAVRKLRQERGLDETTEADLQGRKVEGSGAILSLVGPPGVGKTSLGQSIARALGRKFTRMSLGGMHDEAEIRGHRRTYIGAMPGRIMQAIKRAGVKNPVFMLDEVDKIGADWRGDPSSALLEVLDPQQNHAFRDHYLDVDFDLSQVLFICTGNTTATIPAPLLDRMEIIEIDGYTEYDKLHIAQQYLIPRQLKMNGLLPGEIVFTEPAVRAIIRDFTREAGVRQLEREIGKICRKVATQVAEAKEERRMASPGEAEAGDVETVAEVAPSEVEAVPSEAEAVVSVTPEAVASEASTTATPETPAAEAETAVAPVPVEPIEITPEKVREYLGKPRYRFEAALRTERPGVATGLAWTPTGGEVLFVEAAAMPGQDGNLILTGHLGDVMRESARIALSYVESHLKELGLGDDCCKGKIHLHVPAGAVPKDGPSAGITMVTALVSLLTGRPVYPDLGMTGEVTLQGQVLPIGGLKLKVMAAHRAGLKRILLPKLNDVDLDELPDKIRNEMEFILVEDVNEVLQYALKPKEPEPAPETAPEATPETETPPVEVAMA